MVKYDYLIGVPFKNHGRNVATGLDCYGLVKEVYKKAGINLPEFDADFDDVDKISQIIKGQQGIKSTWKRIKTENGEPIPVPCVMAIRFGVPKPYINHTGVYIGDGLFIHTREKIGVCVDRIVNPAWKKCIEGYYKYEG